MNMFKHMFVQWCGSEAGRSFVHIFFENIKLVQKNEQAHECNLLNNKAVVV